MKKLGLITGMIVIITFVLLKLYPTSDLPAKSTPTQTQPIQSENIIVDEPKSGQIVGKVFQIVGRARVFENVVSIRLSHKDTKAIIFQKTTYANAPDVGRFGLFSDIIDISDANLSDNAKLLLEVYQASAKDGKDVDTVSVDLTYKAPIL